MCKLKTTNDRKPAVFSTKNHIIEMKKIRPLRFASWVPGFRGDDCGVFADSLKPRVYTLHAFISYIDNNNFMLEHDTTTGHRLLLGTSIRVHVFIISGI